MERLLSCHLGALGLGIAGAFASLPAAAQTPPCGTVVTQSIQLNADMHCTGTQPALIVGADNVRIDLNGHAIYGQWNWSILPHLNPRGIVAHGRRNVEVVGPGLIRDFAYDVEIFGGRGHQVSAIAGESMFGVILWGASDSRILENVLSSGIAIVGSMGPPLFAPAPASRNQIVKNRMASATLRLGRVLISGCQAIKNTVAGNEIFGGVVVDGGASGNLVEGNRITGYGLAWTHSVLLGEAYRNEVRDNVIDADGETGIAIEPSLFPACNAGQPGRNGDANTIYANVIRNGSTGLHVGANPAASGTQGTGNVILGNTFIDMTLRGQYFGAGTANNDGRNNKYSNVPVLVEDFGSGNLWP